MSRASEGITTWPENWLKIEVYDYDQRSELLTPAMNKPKATPTSPGVPGETDV